MASGKRSDPAKVRRDQQKIAEDLVRRQQIRSQGDTVAPGRPISPSAGRTIRPPQNRPRRPSQGIVTGRRIPPTDA